MKKAFTLAETLIVMGVIGIVAALTLPNLNQSTNNKEKVAKVKKIYQNLNDAFGRAEAVYGPVDEWCTNLNYDACNRKRFERIIEFMKYSKICNSVSICSMTFGANTSAHGLGNAAILADGTTIGIEGHTIYVDIDGSQKGPNKYGYDGFQFHFAHDKGVYVSDIMSNSSFYVTHHYGSNTNGFHPSFSAAWIINFDNMDYLKTKDGTTCPNGTKLTVGGNHSCN